MATILVVDDRPTNRQFLTMLLGYGGHRLLEAADGAEALRLVRAEHPDLVISDILMPTMDGFEFAKNVRAEPGIADTKIVFYTATYRGQEALMLAKACGVSRVIAKPAEPQVVLDVVNEQLGIAAAKALPRRAIEPIDAHKLAEPKALDLGVALAGQVKDLHGLQAQLDAVVEKRVSLEVARERERLRGISTKFAESVARLHDTSARLSTLIELGMDLAAARERRHMLELFVAAARKLLRARSAVVLSLNTGEDRLQHVASDGLEAAAARAMAAARLDDGLVAEVLAAGKVVRKAAARGSLKGLPEGHPSAGSFLGVRLGTRIACLGMAFFAGKEGEAEFTAEDGQIAEALAAQLAVAYENFDLFDTLQRRAAELQVEVGERERAEAALAQSERGLHRAQVMAKLGHVVTGPDGAFESWSENLAQLAGIDPAAMPRSTREWLERLHPGDGERFRAKSIEAAATGQRAQIEYRLRRADGNWIDIRQVIEPLPAPAGAKERGRWFSTLQDITDEKQAEARIRKLNRVYAVLSGINALIVRVRDRNELFRDACRIAVKDGRFPMAWIGLVDDESGLVKPVASDGEVRDFFERSPLSKGPKSKAKAKGMAWQAVQEKHPVVSNDVQADPQTSMKSECKERGVNSLVMLPLVIGGDAIGVLALYAAETGFFDDEEMRLLMELAGDISFALDHLQKDEKLNYLAYYDELTGLANRALFHERLSQHVSAAGAGKAHVAVVILDIERFKTINDALGRQAGDALLVQIAGRMKQHSDDPARLARISADHFAVVVPGVQSEQEFARRADLRMHQFFDEPFRLGDSELRVSARAGVAMYPDDGADAETLFRNAEAALKKAKASGDKLLFYTQQMTERVAGKLTLETKLREALEKDEFLLHYQPKVEAETRRIVGIEALIRWQSPERGLVPPGHFIPLLEETGLILQVGSWALKRASLDHRAWVEQGLKPPRVAVNVSAIQLRQRDFVAVVEQAIIEGVAPTAIDLELTESLLMEDIKGNIEKLKAVRNLGMNIAIDDFGTGYSSLGYLAQLPVQSLKIDRSFIIRMHDDPNAMTLVSTIISLAHSLRLQVIAEGVETEDQAKFLRLLRCDEMQGYLFSKPVPEPALVELLRAESR